MTGEQFDLFLRIFGQVFWFIVPAVFLVLYRSHLGRLLAAFFFFTAVLRLVAMYLDGLYFAGENLTISRTIGNSIPFMFCVALVAYKVAMRFIPFEKQIDKLIRDFNEIKKQNESRTPE